MKQKTKQLIMTLVALLAVTTGAWADETPLMTIESKDYTSFKSGSMTFDDKVTVTFSSSVRNDGNTMGWYTEEEASLLTVAGINGYTITSCKFYTDLDAAATGYTIEGESPSVYLTGLQVYTDANKSVKLGEPGIKKIEVYGAAASAATPVAITWDEATKTATIASMPAGNVTVNVEYWPGMLTLPAASEGGTVTLEGVINNTIIDENFDDYTAGGKMATTANAAGNSNWTTWNNLPGSDEDGTLATLDDNTCLKVTKDNDQVLLLGDQTSGMWEYSLDVYVPEGKFGYFNLLHDFAGVNSTWAFQCYFNADYDNDTDTYYYSPGHGTVHAGSACTADLPCVVNEWMHVRIVIDIDKDLAKLYFNGQFICEWQWSLASFGEKVFGGKLAACNFWGEDDEFYVDNIKFTQISDLPAGFERDGYGNIYVESGTQFTLVTTPAENYHLASLSDGTNTYDVDDDGKVTITMPDANLTLTAEFAENTYDVSLNKTDLAEGEPAKWSAKSTNVTTEVNLGEADLEGVKKSETVTVTYSGTKKVLGVKAEPAEEPVTLATPLTIEAVTAGTIKVNMTGELSTGMKYSKDGGKTKKPITQSEDIPVAKGDKVQFYGNGTDTQVYYIQNDVSVSINGSGEGFKTKVYGNIMSLLDEEGFATKTELPANNVFMGLFNNNLTLSDASELLLPATELTPYCYTYMFEGCNNLTTAPKLPAKTLAPFCYQGMFMNCTSLTTAPKLPATTLAKRCYNGMFISCSSLTTAYVKAAFTASNRECAGMFNGCVADDAVLHTTPGDNKASWETVMGTDKDWPNWTVADDWQE